MITLFLPCSQTPKNRCRLEDNIPYYSRGNPVIQDYRSKFYQRYVATHLNKKENGFLASRAPYLRRLVSLYFPRNPSAKILELGCGYGALIHYANQAGYTEMKGVDVSMEQVDAAKQLGIVGVSQGDLLETLARQENEALDMVVAFDVIEHFSKTELLVLAEEVHRVLKPEGKWLLHMPNAASPFFGRVRYGDYTHEQAFTRHSASQLLQVAGFTTVRCYEDTPVPHGVKSAARWIGWKLARSAFQLIIAAETGAVDEIFSQNFVAVAQKSACQD